MVSAGGGKTVKTVKTVKIENCENVKADPVYLFFTRFGFSLFFTARLRFPVFTVFTVFTVLSAAVKTVKTVKTEPGCENCFSPM